MVADNFGYIELSDPDAVPRDVLVHSFNLTRRGDELIAYMKLLGEEPASSPIDILKTKSKEKQRAEKRVLLKGSQPILVDTPIVSEVSGDMEIPLFHFASDVEAFLENPSVVKSTDVVIRNTPREVKGEAIKFNLTSRIFGLTFSPTSAKFSDFFVGPIGEKDHRIALHGILAEPVSLNIKGIGKVKLEPGFEMISILKGTITPGFVPTGRVVEPGTPQSATYAEVPMFPQGTPAPEAPSTPAPEPPSAPLTPEQKEQKVREIINASQYSENNKEQLIKIILLPDINPGDSGKKLTDNGVKIPISRQIMRGISVDRCLFNEATCALLNRYVGNLREMFSLETDVLSGRDVFPSVLDEFLRVAAIPTPAPAPAPSTTTPSPSTTTPAPAPAPSETAPTSSEIIPAPAPAPVPSTPINDITNSFQSLSLDLDDSSPAALTNITTIEPDHPSTQLEREIKEKLPDVNYSFSPQPCETVSGKIDDNFVKNVEQLIQLFVNNKYPDLFDEKLQRQVFENQKFAIPLSEIQTENKGQEYTLSMPTKSKTFRTGDIANIVDVQQCKKGEIGITLQIKKDKTSASGSILEKIGGADQRIGFLFELSYGKSSTSKKEQRVKTVKTEAPIQTAGECEKETGKVDDKFKDTVLESMIKFIEKKLNTIDDKNKESLKQNKGLLKFLEETQKESDGKEYTLILPTAQGPTLSLSTGSHKTVTFKIPENCSQDGVILKVNVNNADLSQSTYFNFEFVV